MKEYTKKSPLSHNNRGYIRSAIMLVGIILCVGVCWALFSIYKVFELNELKDYQPKTALSIYSADGILIGQYGMREFKPLSEFPEHLKSAVLLDNPSFIKGKGFSWYLLNNSNHITRQVARQFYFPRDIEPRWINEMMLVHKIHRNLSNDEILSIYLNEVAFDENTYGFATAAKMYFNKNPKDLTLAEITSLVAWSQDPKKFNPLKHPTESRLQQETILNKMLDLNMITSEQRQLALQEKLNYQPYHIQFNPDFLYVAEMVRQTLYDRYGEDIYTMGFQVHTTVHSENQKVATAALRKALRNFESGAAYHGAETQLDLSQMSDVKNEIEQYLSKMHEVEGMYPAVITQIDNRFIEVQKRGFERIQLPRNQNNVANNAIDNSSMGNRALKVGSVIRISQLQDSTHWHITQLPEIQGALVSMETDTGAIRAVVGGYDFHSQALNRALTERELGNVFSPFVYSAALNKGLKKDTLVDDAPIIQGGWSPKNPDGHYAGMITVRDAFIKSKNVVSVRLAHAMGVSYVHRYVQRFGFHPNQVPQDLQMAVGNNTKASPLQMAESYAAFANGGYKVQGYIVDKIYDTKGHLRSERQPLVARQNAQQIIDGRNAHVITSMLQDEIRLGKANRANILGRQDLAGKIATTNDAKETWFVGYNPKIVTSVYMGYDTPRSMGNVHDSTLALQIWIDYMKFALKNISSYQGFPEPKNTRY